MVGIGLYCRKHTSGINGFVLGGRSVGPWLTAFAYGTSYFSAVVFEGYAGKFGRKYGIAATWAGIGNAILGSLLAWAVLGRRTRILPQHYTSAAMPQFFGQRFQSKTLKIGASVIVFVFLIPYTASLFNGLSRLFGMAFHMDYTVCIILMGVLTGIYVIAGGYMATAINDFIQGCVMLVGICMLTVAVFDKVGGPVEGMARLAELAPTATANTGFVSLADGGQGWFIISLVIVTSVAVWAQPQMIQRHFALNSARQVNRITPLAMLVLTVLVGGAYYVASLARLFMPEVASPDDVMPALVKMLLPDIGLQLFVLAIVSASLSTATAIFHIAVAAIAEDLPGRKTSRGMWFAGIVFCVLLSGGCAQIKGQIIAMLCTTSWSIVGSTVLVAYVALVRFGKRSSLAAWCSCAAGFVSCMLWYLMTHPQFAILPMPWPLLAALPPFFVGFAFSLAGWGLGWALDGEGRRNSSFWPAGMKPGM